MTECLTAEYGALVSSTDKMINVISMDTTAVAAKLIAKSLIPLSSLQEEASELVRKINSNVSTFPENFEVILAALNEIPSAKDLARLLHEEYKKIKAKELETLKVQSEQEKLPSPQFTDGDDQENLSPKFPYLNTENLSEDRKARLIARLEVESGKMQDKFAILVDRTRESLQKQNIVCNDLSVLVRHSQKNKLLPLTKKHQNIQDLFLELGDYWTFFDYDFLNVIIERHCPELKLELSNYVSSFKEYCKRRICEVPAHAYSKRGNEHKLCVKCDRNFTTSTLEDIKILECKLSHLLGTELYLLEVEKGCIKLEFNSMCPISTPLTLEQTEELNELKIICLYSDSVVHFNSRNHLRSWSITTTPLHSQRESQISTIMLPSMEEMATPIQETSPNSSNYEKLIWTPQTVPRRSLLESLSRKRPWFDEKECHACQEETSPHQDEDTYPREASNTERVGRKRAWFTQGETQAQTPSHQAAVSDTERVGRKKAKLAKEEAQAQTSTHQGEDTYPKEDRTF